jgi:hypothetical protein
MHETRTRPSSRLAPRCIVLLYLVALLPVAFTRLASAWNSRNAAASSVLRPCAVALGTSWRPAHPVAPRRRPISFIHKPGRVRREAHGGVARALRLVEGAQSSDPKLLRKTLCRTHDTAPTDHLPKALFGVTL